MSQLLRALIEAGKVPLCLDFRMGSLRDVGGVPNDPSSIVGVLRTTSNGRAIRFPPSCTFSVADSATLNLTSLSVVAVVTQRTLGTDRRIVVKRGATDWWDLYVSSAGVLTLKSGAATVTKALVPTTGATSLGATWASGTIPMAYQNASLLGAMSAILTSTGAGAGVLNVGSYTAGSANNTWTDPMLAVVVVNEPLSNADMCRLMRELTDAPGIVSRPRKHFSIPYPSKTPAEYAAEGIILDTDCAPRNGATTDFTGNGRKGTVVGQVDVVKGGPFDEAVRLRGAYALLPSESTIFRTADWDVAAWVQNNETTLSVLFGIGGANHYAALDTNGAFTIGTVTTAPLSRTVKSPNGPLGVWSHVVAGRRQNGANLILRVSVNGVTTETTFAGETGRVEGASVPVLFAYQTAFLPVQKSNVARVRFYTRSLTPAEIREAYLEGARKCLLDARVHSDGSCPVSLAAVGTPSEIANGWKVQSGTWKVVEDAPVLGTAGERWMECQTAGTLSTPDKSAYGSWLIPIKRVAATGSYSNFIADRLGTVLAPLGYAIGFNSTGQVVLIRTTGGGSAVVTLSANAYTTTNVQYYLWVTRRFDGTFTTWIKGGAYAAWTLVPASSGSNPGVDATYTTNRFSLIQAGISDRFDGIIHYLGEMTATEAVALGLIDGPVTEPTGDLFNFTTTDTTQSWTLKLTAGATYQFDWGDGTGVYSYAGTGADQTITHNYAAAGTYAIKLWIDDPTKVLTFNCSSNGLSGILPSLAACTALVNFDCSANSFSGTLPSFATCTALVNFACYRNSFSGTLPSFATCTALVSFWCY